MELERTDNRDRGPVGIADGGARELRHPIDRWWALAAQLVAFAITLFIVTSLLQALQIAVWHADGSVDVFAQPAPGEQQDRTREPLEEGTDPLIAETAPAEGRMYTTEDASEWTGSQPAPTRRIVF